MRALAHEVLDLIGNVGNDLNRAAEEIASTLLADHVVVDLAGGEIRQPRGLAMRKALVVPEIEVGFGPVVGDIDLAMLKRAHGAGIDVQVRIKFDHPYGQAARLENRRE